MSSRQFDSLRASSLFCTACGKAQPVREKLLLVLPDKELHEYLCTVCGAAVGTREIAAAEKLMNDAIAARRAGRTQVRIL